MITMQIEPAKQIASQLKDIIVKHHEEVAQIKDKRQVNVNYDYYMRLDAAGELMVATIREDGVLKGYYVGVIKNLPHYKQILSLIDDAYFVAPELRHSGTTGEFIGFIEKEAKRRGVVEIFFHTKAQLDKEAFFARQGFSKSDIIYHKWVGD